MNIKEALQFELDHNFNVTEEEKKEVLENASHELDFNDSAEGSYINFFEYVDECLCSINSMPR